jgi:peptidoglycan/LPS O-acetylase OafA/YrhL
LGVVLASATKFRGYNFRIMLKKLTMILIGIAVLATAVLTAHATKWYEKSDWWLVIVAAFTGCVICWQSYETRRAANAQADGNRAWIFADLEKLGGRMYSIGSGDGPPKN